ncbi:Inositol-1,4,5-trisphosphate 5-phosphatase 1-like protein 1 [Botrytis cinerea]
MAGSSEMKALSLYFLTFNCGLTLIDTDAFASQLFNGLSSPNLPDLLVLSLQEIAPIPYSLIGGSFLVPYFNRFHDAVGKASKKLSNDGSAYTSIAARNVGLTGIMIFAKDPTLIQDLEASEIGVGAWSMGNKGAVGIRFTYGSGNTSTELTFVAAHLAAMEEELQRRNQDWKDIVRGLVFSSTTSNYSTTLPRGDEDRPLLSISPQDGSIFKATSHLFFGGDLNYRTSLLSPAPNDHIDTFPQPGDSTSSSNHYATLFKKRSAQPRKIGWSNLPWAYRSSNIIPTYI